METESSKVSSGERETDKPGEGKKETCKERKQETSKGRRTICRGRDRRIGGRRKKE